MIRTTLHGACPSCGEGTVFRSYYELRPRCVQCDLDLEGQHGAHYGGPIALGYGVGAVAGLGTFSLLFWRFGFEDWVVWCSVAALVIAVLVAFRFCKAWWTWWLFAAGELSHGE